MHMDICQLHPVFEENKAALTLDYDMNRGYTPVMYRGQEWRGVGNRCDYLISIPRSVKKKISNLKVHTVGSLFHLSNYSAQIIDCSN